MQKIIENGTIVLIADEGKVLTDGVSFGSIVRLGKEVDESAWYEIAEEEYNAIVDDEEATEADYRQALRELGVEV